MKQQSGFTLIELVVVIVLLGILAAAATARFQDLATEARIAAVAGIAGEIASGSAINFGARSVNAANGVAVAGCAASGGLLQQGAVPAGYTVTQVSGCTAPTGGTAECTVEDDALPLAAIATYNVICIP